MAYCRWLSSKFGYELRLPYEWEWQWAAMSANAAFQYPWGEAWRDDAANTSATPLSRSTTVGMYVHGRTSLLSVPSQQQVFDLSGNVREWCLNKYQAPGDADLTGVGQRVVRGASWYYGPDLARAAFRSTNHPVIRNDLIGFRVVCVSPIL